MDSEIVIPVESQNTTNINIISHPSSKQGNHQENRKKDNDSEDNKGPICILISICILIMLVLTVFIIAVVYSYKYENDTCVTKYGNISFNYIYWLRVQGFMSIFQIIFSSIFIVLLDNEQELQMIFSSCMNILFITFDFSWFIVGSVLYFNEVESSCNSSSDIYKFGMALFILQLVSFTGICCKIRN